MLWTIAACIAGLIAAGLIYWWILHIMLAIPTRAREVHWVKTSDLWQIRLCRYGGEHGGEPVFLCHSVLANHFNFALPEEEGMVDILVKAGYDCWVIDLRGNRDSTPPFGQRRMKVCVDDHLLRDLPAAIDYIRKNTGYNQVHWVGHSYGGMLLYAFEQLFGRDYIASGTTLGTPPGFTGIGFRYPRIAVTILRFSPALMDFILRGLTPLACLVKPNFEFLPINWKNMHPKIKTAHLFNVLQIMPPKVGAELAFWASHDIWSMNGDKLDVIAGLNKLQTPLFAIYGGADPLTPWKNIHDFFTQLPNDDKQLMYLTEEDGFHTDYSHVDLAFAVEGVEEVFEPIAAWLKEHPIKDMYQEPPKEGDEAVQEPHTDENKVVAVKKTAATKKPAAKKKAAATKKPAAKKKAVATKKPTAKKKAVAKKKPAAKKKAAATKMPAAKKKAVAKKKPAAVTPGSHDEDSAS